MAFCEWLSNREGRRYRLPTEAEWEYCCRAGSQTTYPWGNNPDDGGGFANCWDLTAHKAFPELDDKFFNWSDGYIYTSPVGRFKPNAWGLYDMVGNAKQWCSDNWGIYPAGDAVDPQGPAVDIGGGHSHVVRGGSWWYPPLMCRCASRFLPPTDDTCEDGFRVVLDLNAVATEHARAAQP